MRKIVVYSSSQELATASNAVTEHGGRILKSLPLAKSLVIDIPEEKVDVLRRGRGVIRVEDDVRVRCD